jgi:hypothetical protein
MVVKTCKQCKLDKNSDDFYKHKCVCKTCCSENKKIYNKKNKKKQSEVFKIWYEKTKADRREHKRLYAKNKRKTDKLFHLRESISRLIRTSITRNNYKKKSKTQEIIGCSFEEFKIHIESQFESWMVWGNRGKYNGKYNYGWDMDHIIPVSSAQTEEEIIKLNHYTNFQPLCSKVNRDEKKDNLFFKRK